MDGPLQVVVIQPLPQGHLLTFDLRDDPELDKRKSTFSASRFTFPTTLTSGLYVDYLICLSACSVCAPCPAEWDQT